jgi:hypothetical protein
MTNRMVYVLAVVLFGIVIAVADMNWPSHMGPQNVLVDALVGMFK